MSLITFEVIMENNKTTIRPNPIRDHIQKQGDFFEKELVIKNLPTVDVESLLNQMDHPELKGNCPFFFRKMILVIDALKISPNVVHLDKAIKLVTEQRDVFIKEINNCPHIPTLFVETIIDGYNEIHARLLKIKTV